LGGKGGLVQRGGPREKSITPEVKGKKKKGGAEEETMWHSLVNGSPEFREKRR